MPPFSGTLSDGTAWSSAAHAGRPLIVFFYPRDFTSVCTKEACAFRDLYDGLQREFGAEVVGISRDSVERHARFKAEHRLPFPLLADDGSISKAFEVTRLWGLLPFTKRVTFVADAAGVLRGVFHHELDVAAHLRDVRACLTEIAGSAPR
jgi:thioredoxin-dependent peroxiredoxin